ncbi:MAG: hypothetical protein FWD16_00715 [Clostridia bacterium]|nr:hypothetical protein [Clostridia bacterium]
MKKLIVPGCILLAVCLIGVGAYFVFWWPPAKLLTGKMADLQQVTIIEGPHHERNETAITDISTMQDLYYYVSQVKVRANKRPSHLSSWQADSRYELVFDYKDKQDVVQISQEGAKILRFLSTRGPDGDPGFVHGFVPEIVIMTVEYALK